MPKACIHDENAHLVDLQGRDDELFCDMEIDPEDDARLISKNVFIYEFLEEI